MVDELLKVEDHIKDGTVKEVMALAQQLIKGETMSIEKMGELVDKLAGYALYIGPVAGLYKGESDSVEYREVKDTLGTIKDKEAAGKIACAELSKRYEILQRMFKALLAVHDGVRDKYREAKKDYRMNFGSGDEV